MNYTHLLFLASVLVVASCSGPSQLEKIRKEGKLTVLTTNVSTTYYFDRHDEPIGPEYQMTQSFAESLGVKVEYKIYENTDEILNALRNGEGDIAAAGLTITSERSQEFRFGPAYQEIGEYLVCHRNGVPIDSIEDIVGIEIVVPASTSYIDTLKEHPELTWRVDKNLKTHQLIADVADRKIECTVSDSTIFDIERRYYPELSSSFILKEGTQLAWITNKNYSQLTNAIEKWFTTYKSNGEHAWMMEKYYGYIDIFDYVDTHKLLKRVKTRLPKYKDMFIDAAKKNDLSASMLAAQSYQESHWDRKAKSPTGVRGIMMLTQPVARSLGVTNRLHAKQNIYAGAKFMAKQKKMFEHVEEPDKTWLTLAVYNVGRGHFRDAQSLAKKLNKDPDVWVEMKEVLPLLSDKKYYKDLRYGYARGNEPVRYVARIRNYNDLIKENFE